MLFSAGIYRGLLTITSKAYKTLGLIRRCFNRNIPQKNLYISLVLSQITYCSVIWRPHLIKDIIEEMEWISLWEEDLVIDFFTKMKSLIFEICVWGFDRLDIKDDIT